MLIKAPFDLLKELLRAFNLKLRAINYCRFIGVWYGVQMIISIIGSTYNWFQCRVLILKVCILSLARQSTGVKNFYGTIFSLDLRMTYIIILTFQPTPVLLIGEIFLKATLIWIRFWVIDHLQLGACPFSCNSAKICFSFQTFEWQIGFNFSDTTWL